METLSKQTVLSKTNSGTDIYAFILRQFYPDSTVMHITGWDCGHCRNPFNGDKPTLHIHVHKEQPGVVYSAQYALHHDEENAIPDGDTFDFAELFYHQSGDTLLQSINRDLHLHIGETIDFFSHKLQVMEPTKPIYSQFSFFKAPIKNIKPHRAVSIPDIYNYITGDYARKKTETLRKMIADCKTTKEIRNYKASAFDYATFSGIFTTRNENQLVRHSSLLCLDFDHVKEIDSAKNTLLSIF